MSTIRPDGPIQWPYMLDEVLGIAVLLAVIALYSALFAWTRPNRLGWAATALISLFGIAVLVWISPATRTEAIMAEEGASGCDCGQPAPTLRPASASGTGQHLL